MKLSEIKRESPKFDFENYFTGHTRVSGWFSDRFGNVKRHFCGDFYGQRDSSYFILDESLYYTDNVEEHRVWTIEFDKQGFVATSPALVGQARGNILGNTLQMRYKMKVDVGGGDTWLLGMNDWMFYQPDGSLHNSAIVSKWGVKIGTVSAQYAKHNGELLCKLAS